MVDEILRRYEDKREEEDERDVAASEKIQESRFRFGVGLSFPLRRQPGSEQPDDQHQGQDGESKTACTRPKEVRRAIRSVQTGVLRSLR